MYTVDVRGYNAILSIANFVKDSNEDRWNYIVVSLLAAVSMLVIICNVVIINFLLFIVCCLLWCLGTTH